MDLPLFHILLQIQLQGGICNKSHLHLQPSRESLQKGIQMLTNVVEPISRRPATVPRDENLEANSPAAAESSRRNVMQRWKL
jgi:hypothetical protein